MRPNTSGLFSTRRQLEDFIRSRRDKGWSIDAIAGASDVAPMTVRRIMTYLNLSTAPVSKGLDLPTLPLPGDCVEILKEALAFHRMAVGSAPQANNKHWTHWTHWTNRALRLLETDARNMALRAQVPATKETT